MLRVAVFSLVTVVVLPGCFGGNEGRNEGEPAPDFTITDVDGAAFTLSDHRGDVVLLQLMGANCPTCHAMTKRVLKPYWDSYEEPPFALISVDLGDGLYVGGRSEAETRAWRDEFNATWTVARDTSEAGVGEKYDLIALPTLYLIGRDGAIAWRYGGTPSIDTLRAEVEGAVAA